MKKLGSPVSFRAITSNIFFHVCFGSPFRLENFESLTWLSYSEWSFTPWYQFSWKLAEKSKSHNIKQTWGILAVAYFDSSKERNVFFCQFCEIYQRTTENWENYGLPFGVGFRLLLCLWGSSLLFPFCTVSQITLFIEIHLFFNKRMAIAASFIVPIIQAHCVFGTDKFS